MKIMNQKKGQALVEFAVVLPLLMLIFVGVFEFGRIYNAKIIVTEAAREGARRGIITTVDADVKTAVWAASATLGTTKTAAQNQTIVPVTIDRTKTVPPGGGANSQPSVIVTASYEVQLVSGLLRPFYPTNKATVTGRAQMRAE